LFTVGAAKDLPASAPHSAKPTATSAIVAVTRVEAQPGPQQRRIAMKDSGVRQDDGSSSGLKAARPIAPPRPRGRNLLDLPDPPAASQHDQRRDTSAPARLPSHHVIQIAPNLTIA
jgi:hypothetical protein